MTAINPLQTSLGTIITLFVSFEAGLGTSWAFLGKEGHGKILGKIKRGLVSRRAHGKSRGFESQFLFQSKPALWRPFSTNPTHDGRASNSNRPFCARIYINLHKWPKKIQTWLSCLPHLKRSKVQHFPSFFPTFLLIFRSKIGQYRRKTFPKARWSQEEPGEAVAQEANTWKSFDQPILDVWKLIYLHTRWSQFYCIM